MKKERFKLISAVYLLLFDGEKVLLSRRFNTGYKDGMYGVPSGHLDGDESVTEAMSRETKEEIDLDITPGDLEVVHVIHKRTKNEKEDDERIVFFLSPTKWTGEIKNMEPEKCDDLSWFPIDDLPSNTIEYIKVAINNIQNDIFYSELGWE